MRAGAARAPRAPSPSNVALQVLPNSVSTGFNFLSCQVISSIPFCAALLQAVGCCGLVHKQYTMQGSCNAAQCAALPQDNITLCSQCHAV